ncbi:MAG: agmatinase [Pseudomonadota bacterium]
MTLENAKSEVDRALTGPKKGRDYENTFAGAVSFLRRRYAKDVSGYDLAVTGIPFDGAVTNRPGARFGPRAIREASTLLPFDPPYGWGFDPLEEFAIADAGDVAFDYAQPGDVPGLIEAHAAKILASGAALLSLGGDHSVSLPLIRAHAANHGPVALLQFDAHTDTWPDDNRARNDHGTMFYKAVKDGLLDIDHSVQVGIRTTNEDTLGIAQIDAREVHVSGPVVVAQKIKEVVGGAPVYLSFDIDVLDPAAAPGTGTPVWGGLTSGQAAVILRDIAGINVVGADVVEVSPSYDTTGATAIAAAHAALELICLWAWTRRAGA